VYAARAEFPEALAVERPLLAAVPCGAKVRIGVVLMSVAIREEERRLARVVRYLAGSPEHACFVVAPASLVAEMKNEELLVDADEIHPMRPEPNGGYLVSYPSWQASFTAAFAHAEAARPASVVHHSRAISWFMVPARLRQRSLVEVARGRQPNLQAELALRLAVRGGAVEARTNVPTWGGHLKNQYDKLCAR